jgi:hypothetical protein
MTIKENQLFEPFELPEPKPAHSYVIDHHEIRRFRIDADSFEDACEKICAMDEEEWNKEGSGRCGDLILVYEDGEESVE